MAFIYLYSLSRKFRSNRTSGGSKNEKKSVMIFYWEGERSHVEGYQLTSSVLLTIEYWMKMERGTSTREMWWIGGGEICTGGGVRLNFSSTLGTIQKHSP